MQSQETIFPHHPLSHFYISIRHILKGSPPKPSTYPKKIRPEINLLYIPLIAILNPPLLKMPDPCPSSNRAIHDKV
jgi:hypothetical protein